MDGLLLNTEDIYTLCADNVLQTTAARSSPGYSFAVHIITFFSFDKIGRRYSLCISTILLGGTMFGTAIATATGNTSSSSSPAASAAIALLILWYCMYGFH
ncbi:hypothetical protein BDV29DRAFT_157441 [Aspergillus leporis]|uniref:Uncharacterized protein n=1 Tax=Aspergillus leporis TaxID=41062 RepID=A0A5N5X254_9EURO|nr:hypothetical protein BDV29DRAFT_157441 [Aspergillus leporis]